MKSIFLTILLYSSIQLFAQQKIEKLQYAETLIEVPKNCTAKSEYEILDCNGFSAQWLFFNEEMVKQKINEQIFKQIEGQFDYKSKKSITFFSQNQPFEGFVYNMKNGSSRIIGFGKVNEIALLLNLGFQKEPKNNDELTLFEKNFITFK
ncbi:hypothetical protein [Flavobacterium terrigena]|uniref:Uncharacterized protein n=1 Tax=Flavobacterium terrigena TaxID=402734 RepID=A0A1H6XYF5_9FLAO|nr:hypothetical protein [Flavobacterium terrigena]SEJ29605.1 hypothetical protein SAMN05660918_2879 [Flavobacterium terrigena]